MDNGEKDYFAFMTEHAVVDPGAAQNAQWSYLITALSVVASVSLNLFHYRAASDYYSNGDVLSTNWWQLAAWIKGYGALTIFSMALIF